MPKVRNQVELETSKPQPLAVCFVADRNFLTGTDHHQSRQIPAATIAWFEKAPSTVYMIFRCDGRPRRRDSGFL